MRQQSILFGNGFNLLSKGTPSWDKLIYDISSKDLNPGIPNTLKYEAIMLGKPYKSDTYLAAEDGSFITSETGELILMSSDMTETLLKQKVASRVKDFQSNPAYSFLAKLNVDHYITTNYDNTLINTIGDKNLLMKVKSERLYSIRRRYGINNQGKVISYWPIHGNIDTPASIMLGFDHYCGSLNRIESYIKGTYEMPEHGVIERMSDRLKESINEPLSWIDLLFTSDIHIIGLGLSFEETDLWWVLNKRARMKWAGDNIFNRIFYYPTQNLSNDIRQMLQQFDV